MLAQLLKTETCAAHHALDHHPLLSQLFKPELSAETYARILISMRGVQEQCEAMLATVSRQLPHHSYFDFPSRMPLLDNDLRNLGQLPSTIASISDPIVINNAGAYVGMAYVIEGSALGGQHIARYLHNAKPSLPVGFFSSSGIDCKQRWNSFWEFANSYCDETQYENAVAIAVQTFDLYRAQMDRYLNDFSSAPLPLSA